MAYNDQHEILGYDGELFREGQELVRQSRLDLDAVIANDDNYELILSAVVKAIIGTRKASEAIHHPVTTPLEYNDLFNRTRNPGDPSHFISDTQNLETLERFMEPDFRVLPPGYGTSISSY